ncbi:MAG: HNH endonuclease [Dehalococcoidia bacterium]
MALYDHAIYKQLPKNDLPIEAHQGGPVIPKALLRYFPPLPPPTTAATEELHILADLYDGATPVASVSCRWHYQTWGGTRPPEYRITQNIGLLLGSAEIDDILTFERQIDTVDRYKLTLARAGTSRFRAILGANAGARWGAVVPGNFPRTLTGIERDVAWILKEAEAPFQLFEPKQLAEAHARLMRDAAFSRLVKRAYDHHCAACGAGYIAPIDEAAHEPPSEPQAAHIVPVSMLGSDDIRNGLCLCRAHHWAFDRRILYVDQANIWRVTDASKRENRNNVLNDVDGLVLGPPKSGFPPPADEALAWHRQWVLAG